MLQTMNTCFVTNNGYPYPYYEAEAKPEPQPFGPQHIVDINLIRHQLGCLNLNELQILSMARDALLHGFMQEEKLYIYGEYCHKFIHQNIVFVLSEGFDAVVTMIWDKDTQIIGDKHINTSTFPLNTNDYECMLDEECIDEIVNNLIDDNIDIDHCLYSNYSPQMRPIQVECSMQSLSTSSSNPLPDILITDHLYNDLNRRIFGDKLKNKEELITQIQTAIHINKVPMHYIGQNNEFCVWIDRFYVYCTKKDEWRLCDIFAYNEFQTKYGECHESLISRNSSKRSIISDYCSCNTSKDDNKDKSEYHTIYLKPIIERMKVKTTKCVDTEFIIEIVDNCIKYGVKRQISKRTFEFKWKSYTIIMSKSLKTILDVTISMNKDVITVHPDVVSIISKKCPILDYFTIQKLANLAKLTASFTTKKNDYRQQFIYDFSGCRIVFASNHTTIVEMQCNDSLQLNIN